MAVLLRWKPCGVVATALEGGVWQESFQPARKQHDQGSKSKPESGTPLRSACTRHHRRSRKSGNPSTIAISAHSAQPRLVLTTRELNLHI